MKVIEKFLDLYYEKFQNMSFDIEEDQSIFHQRIFLRRYVRFCFIPAVSGKRGGILPSVYALFGLMQNFWIHIFTPEHLCLKNQ